MVGFGCGGLLQSSLHQGELLLLASQEDLGADVDSPSGQSSLGDIDVAADVIELAIEPAIAISVAMQTTNATLGLGKGVDLGVEGVSLGLAEDGPTQQVDLALLLIQNWLDLPLGSGLLGGLGGLGG